MSVEGNGHGSCIICGKPVKARQLCQGHYDAAGALGVLEKFPRLPLKASQNQADVKAYLEKNNGGNGGEVLAAPPIASPPVDSLGHRKKTRLTQWPIDVEDRCHARTPPGLVPPSLHTPRCRLKRGHQEDHLVVVASGGTYKERRWRDVPAALAVVKPKSSTAYAICPRHDCHKRCKNLRGVEIHMGRAHKGVAA